MIKNKQETRQSPQKKNQQKINQTNKNKERKLGSLDAVEARLCIR